MSRYRLSSGFALPTVVITATILLAVMVSVMSTVSSTDASVGTQYYEGMASDAAESGAAVAKNCLQASGGTASWTDGSPLRPSSDCTGASTCSAEACFLVFESNVVRTTYAVSAPEVSGDSNVIKSVGTVELLRASDGSVWKSYSHTAILKDTSHSPDLTFTKVSMGALHACGIVGGSAYCWGSNTYGQLGNGNKIDQARPVAVDTSTGLAGKTITDIAAGFDSTCAIASGQIYCWGYNNYGQLGNGNTSGQTKPSAVDVSTGLSGKTITSIVAQSSYACAIASGQIYCWGYNNYGQLGNGNTAYQTKPSAVDVSTGLSGKTATSIVIGGNAGNSAYSHTCAIASAYVYCWGLNDMGQLGDGSSTNQSKPVAVDDSTGMTGAATEVSLGMRYTCAVAAGQVYCWGDGSTGQLGNGGLARQSTPVKVDTSTGLGGKTISTISAGYDHACAIASGKVYCWGDGYSGALGDGNTNAQTKPVAVDGSTGMTGVVTDISLGIRYACALTLGQVYCWGLNDYGQLGDGTTTWNSYPQKVDSSKGIASSGATSLSTNYSGACAIVSGDAYCWGDNFNGQLGSGDIAWSGAPKLVDTSIDFSGKSVSYVSAGVSSTCAVASGKAYCWGDNQYGQLGTGDTTSHNSPVAVDTSTGLAGKTVTRISLGGSYACAVASGQAYCWGNNGWGQFGVGDKVSRNKPVAVDTSTGLAGKTVTDVATGAAHMCVLASARAYCSGYGSFNALGTGNGSSQLYPSLSGVSGSMLNKDIALLASDSAGYVFPGTYAVDASGQLYCWGSVCGISDLNSFNGMTWGGGTYAGNSTPVIVDLNQDIESQGIDNISVGTTYGCLVSAHKLYCWGYNAFGQIGTSDNFRVPNRVLPPNLLDTYSSIFY